MTRPSARPVPPGSARRTSTGHPTPDPCAKLLEERIALRLRHREPRVPGRDASPYVTAAVEYGPGDRVVPRGRGVTGGAPDAG